MKNLKLLLLLFIFSTTAYASTFIGKLTKNGQFTFQTIDGQDYDLEIPFKYRKYLNSLTESFFLELVNEVGQKYPDYYLAFNGKQINGKLKVKRSPTLMSAPNILEGILEKRQDNYFINQTQIHFESALKVNRTSFGLKTINSYIGKSILALSKTNEFGQNILTAVVPKNLYSSTMAPEFSPKEIQIKGLKKVNFIEKIETYLLGTVYSNDISKRGSSFRQTLFKRKLSTVKAGDKALVITLSGRQGDDPGALAGHLAAGMATVKTDLSLDMELWNYYHVPNEKLIMSGHNHFIDYYGHLTAGQNNYRPTYTLVLYGVDEKIMMKMRDELDIDFYQMREAIKEFGVNYNCTTETVHALRRQGFKGKRYTSKKGHFLKKLGTILISPFEILSIPFTSQVTELRYSIQKDPNRYVPRAAFDGLLKSLKKLKEKFGITRADYIFHAQNKSRRVMGGAPALGLLPVYYGKNKATEILENPSQWPISRIHYYIESLMINDQF